MSKDSHQTFATGSNAAEKPSDQFPNEDILPGDYPVYGNYLYVADGKVYRSDWHDIRVFQLKVREGFKEVRRCNIAARQDAARKGRIK